MPVGSWSIIQYYFILPFLTQFSFLIYSRHYTIKRITQHHASLNESYKSVFVYASLFRQHVVAYISLEQNNTNKAITIADNGLMYQ